MTYASIGAAEREVSVNRRLATYAWLDDRLEQWARQVSDGRPATGATGGLLGRLAGEGAEVERRGRRGDGQLAWASTIRSTAGESTLPDDVLAIDRAVAGLPPAIKGVVVEHYFGRGRVIDKARALSCSVDSYYRRLLRGYEQLAQHVRR